MEHLIPPDWFTGLPVLALLLLIAVSVAILGKGADLMVDGAAGMAYRFGLPKVVVGATIVSLGTTSPEFAVSVMAAWKGEAGLALGNAVGSIIADTGLIFGLGCIMAVLPADRFVLSRQGWVQFGGAVLLAVICYLDYAVRGPEATIGRGLGILFLALLAGYMVMSVRWSRSHHVTQDPEAEEHAEGAGKNVGSLILLVVLGLVMVIVSSHVLIHAVTELALRWGVPDVVVAGTVVALGTSLPELVIGLTSVRKGHGELLVGNIVGADILNVLFVTGGAAVAADLPIIETGAAVPHIFLVLHLPVMLAILTLFRVFIWRSTRRGYFHRWYGAPLLLIYLGYILTPFLMPH
ncbi:MAG: sodium:calcium antiporter [Candidatus Eisenbacteria bacterium]|uniref:Sodium:calcium antiporter n=1 Tax=Eiseniibacteriota bacterium TaxID=2212470 RepID=A0A956LWS8_UNCEI|nr:sodium:calcium antiporter [Candidatus Eisenbacteria bacterium]